MPEKTKDTKQPGGQLGLTVKKAENFSEWYTQAVLKAELADYSPVKGCMIIRPNGYALWENIQRVFDEELRKLGVRNAYFPLFIPESFFKKEAEHVAGFAPEVAWIEAKPEEERIAIRPTSETIIYDAYSKWIRSWRDLPLRLNQWCNIVRWETEATKLFLRTREFLWQEGHTVHATAEEAGHETVHMLKEYQRFFEQKLGLPAIAGRKSESEKFAGAEYTTTLEAFMPDGRALQLATSHNLGQRFAKAFGISFLGKDGRQHLAWQTSWGFSTRLIGAMVMLHGDDRGIIVPPEIAPTQAVIVPIWFGKDKAQVLKASRKLEQELAAQRIRVLLDDRESYTPGWKFNDWELKGVPLRIELGPKDIAKKLAVLVRRDDNKKMHVPQAKLAAQVKKTLVAIQKALLERAKRALSAAIIKVEEIGALEKAIEDKRFVLAPWCGDAACEASIKEHTGATSRCIPFEKPKRPGRCVFCKKATKTYAYFARAY